MVPWLQGRTLTFTPGPTVIREAQTKTLELGRPGFAHLYDLHTRPIYKFTLSVGPLVRAEAECLSALHALHMGGRSFFWDGGRYGGLDSYVVIGEGNGYRKEYFLFNRYVGAGSISVRTLRPATQAVSVWTSGVSLSPNPGVLSLLPPPASGDSIQAKWGCFYRVHFAPDGLKMDQIAKDLYQAEMVLNENLTLLIDEPVSQRQTFFWANLDAQLKTVTELRTRTPIVTRVLAAVTAKAANIVQLPHVSGLITYALTAKTQATTAITRRLAITRALAAARIATPVITRLGTLRRGLAAQVVTFTNMVRSTVTAGAVTQKAVPARARMAAGLSKQMVLGRALAARHIDAAVINRTPFTLATPQHGIATIPASYTYFVLTGLPTSGAITAVPEWPTQVWVSSRTGTTGAVNFGTQPTTGSFLDWSIIQ